MLFRSIPISEIKDIRSSICSEVYFSALTTLFIFFNITFAAFSGLVGALSLKAITASSFVGAFPKKISG